MTQCKNPKCFNTDIVYSGTDALIYGVPTEVLCYTCSETYMYLKEIVNEQTTNYTSTDSPYSTRPIYGAHSMARLPSRDERTN